MASVCQAFEVEHARDQSITELGSAWHLLDDERLPGLHPQVITPFLSLNSALESKAGRARSGGEVNPTLSGSLMSNHALEPCHHRLWRKWALIRTPQFNLRWI